MQTITARVNTQIVHSAQRYAKINHISLSEYLRMALFQFNQYMREKDLNKQLQSASIAVRNNSMDINKDFSEIMDDKKL